MYSCCSTGGCHGQGTRRRWGWRSVELVMTAPSPVAWFRWLVKRDAVLAGALGATMFVASLATNHGLP